MSTFKVRSISIVVFSSYLRILIIIIILILKELLFATLPATGVQFGVTTHKRIDQSLQRTFEQRFVFPVSKRQTTINLCIFLSSASNANVATALCNAILGNLLGILVTPAWLLYLFGGKTTQGGTLNTVNELLR